MNESGNVCELCNQMAAVYCGSDSAFLCWNCDSEVHRANFLVARHVRQPVCSKCKVVDLKFVSGGVIRPFTTICGSCSSGFVNGGDDEGEAGNEESVCVSINESTKKRDGRSSEKMEISGVTENRGENSLSDRLSIDNTSDNRQLNTRFRAAAKAYEVMENWCKMLGLHTDLSARVTSHASSVRMNQSTALPFRMVLAASFWFSLRLNSKRVESTTQNLRRLEQISGVSARLIITGEVQVSRVMRDRQMRHNAVAKGWAESSG